MSSKQAPKKAPAKKAPAKKVVVETPVEEVAVPAPATKTKKSSTAPKKQRVRRVVTKESLETDFATLQKRIEDEITKLRDSTEKVKGVKFLRSVNKAVKLLKSDSLRVLKIKPKTNRSRTTTSGFMKPVKISQEMADFTKWDSDKLYSRVDVTKFICAYIKDKNLQKPDDKRQIVVNPELSKLLKYDPAVAKEPLTYFRLQQYIQPHFIKDPVAATPAAVSAATPVAAPVSKPAAKPTKPTAAPKAAVKPAPKGKKPPAPVIEDEEDEDDEDVDVEDDEE